MSSRRASWTSCPRSRLLPPITATPRPTLPTPRVHLPISSPSFPRVLAQSLHCSLNHLAEDAFAAATLTQPASPSANLKIAWQYEKYLDDHRSDLGRTGTAAASLSPFPVTPAPSLSLSPLFLPLLLPDGPRPTPPLRLFLLTELVGSKASSHAVSFDLTKAMSSANLPLFQAVRLPVSFSPIPSQSYAIDG